MLVCILCVFLCFLSWMLEWFQICSQLRLLIGADFSVSQYNSEVVYPVNLLLFALVRFVCIVFQRCWNVVTLFLWIYLVMESLWNSSFHCCTQDVVCCFLSFLYIKKKKLPLIFKSIRSDIHYITVIRSLVAFD